MNDLELQLMNLLKTNWQIERKDILFHRNMRRVEGALTQPNIIIAEQADVNDWSNESMADCRAVILVHTRVNVGGTTNEALEEAKVLKFDMRKEVYRILLHTSRGILPKPDRWDWAFPTRRLNSDNFDIPSPFLGEDIFVTIAYQIVEGEDDEQ